ncbi:MAG: hypothetical protein AAGK37_05410 [Pseudomonadota bacterium]
MRSIALTLATPLLLLACGLPPNGVNPAGINVATADSVTGCAPVIKLTSTPGLSGPALRDEVFQAARNRMAQDALGAGGDTIVFVVGGPEDTDALFIEGIAYRCGA